jgi:hypothetical protein
MLAIVDGDIVRYRTGFASNDVNEAIACARANETMEQILGATGANRYRVYLSDSLENNYRTKLSPTYKSSRLKQPKPIHHEALGLFLKQEWGAVVSPLQEADDALGIDQTFFVENGGYYDYDYGESVICSIDKDLLQVPGKHYNWVKNEWFEQNYLEGLRCFYVQCLTGDRTDDVSGIQGIGPVKAGRALAGCETEEEMIEVCRGMWNDDAAFQLAGSLLWVRRYEGEMWSFTRGIKQKSLSSNMQHEEQDPSSEHGSPGRNGVPPVGLQEADMTPTDSPL